jgi:hypothetical protein
MERPRYPPRFCLPATATTPGPAVPPEDSPYNRSSALGLVHDLVVRFDYILVG